MVFKAQYATKCPYATAFFIELRHFDPIGPSKELRRKVVTSEFFDLPVDGSNIDSQELCRLPFVTLRCFESLNQDLSFYVFKRRSDSNRNHLRFLSELPDLRGKMPDIDHVGIVDHKNGLEGVLQLAHIPAPLVVREEVHGPSEKSLLPSSCIFDCICQ